MSYFKPYTNIQKFKFFQTSAFFFFFKGIGIGHKECEPKYKKVPESIKLQMVVETGSLFIKIVSTSSWAHT